MKSIAQIVCGFAALFNAVPAFAGTSQGWLYWTEGSNTIKRSHLDGTNVEIVYSSLDGVSSPIGLALDPDTNQLYWSEHQGGIKRGSLDGTVAPVTVVPPVSPLYPESFGEIAADFDGSTIHWFTTFSSTNAILKLDIDGSGFDEIILEGPAPTALAIDVAGGKLYWSLAPDLQCPLPAKIQRSDLDGTNIEDVATGLKFITALAVDHASAKIYWSDNPQCGGNTIKRANFDGTGIETLVSGEYGLGIALDPAGGKMYWTRVAGEPDVVRWANFDGTEAADLISVGVQSPVGIAVLPPNGSPADLNGDGVVNGIDLAILLGAWGACPPRGAPGSCDADLAPPPAPGGGGGDGVVNGFDLALLLGSWS